jgi:hypothetical protein
MRWNSLLSRCPQLGSQSHQWGLHKCSCEWIPLPILQYSLQHLSHLGRGWSTPLFLKPHRLPCPPILFHHRCYPSYSCLLPESPVPQLPLEASPYSIVPWWFELSISCDWNELWWLGNCGSNLWLAYLKASSWLVEQVQLCTQLCLGPFGRNRGRIHLLDYLLHWSERTL